MLLGEQYKGNKIIIKQSCFWENPNFLSSFGYRSKAILGFYVALIIFWVFEKCARTQRSPQAISHFTQQILHFHSFSEYNQFRCNSNLAKMPVQSIFFSLNHFFMHKELVFCYQNCSELLWNRIVLNYCEIELFWTTVK